MNAHEAALLTAIQRGRKLRLAALGSMIAIPVAYGAFRLASGARDRIRERAELAEREAADEPSDADRAEIEHVARAVFDRIATTDAAWKAVMRRDGLATIAPGDAPCERPFDQDLVIVQRGEAIPSVDPEVTRASVALVHLRGALADDDITKDALWHERWAVDLRSTVVVLVDAFDPPQTAGKDYIPGSIAGTAYLFDVATNTIACTAHVAARSSDAVTVSYNYRVADSLDHDVQATLAAGRVLKRDLELSLAGEVEHALRRVH